MQQKHADTKASGLELVHESAQLTFARAMTKCCATVKAMRGLDFRRFAIRSRHGHQHADFQQHQRLSTPFTRPLKGGRAKCCPLFSSFQASTSVSPVGPCILACKVQGQCACHLPSKPTTLQAGCRYCTPKGLLGSSSIPALPAWCGDSCT